MSILFYILIYLHILYYTISDSKLFISSFFLDLDIAGDIITFMEKKILIVQNITREGPGIIEGLLKERNINYTTVDLDKGEFCRNQIVKIGANAYGIQCHFELTPEMFELWLDQDDDLSRLDKKQLQNEFNSFLTEYTSTGRKLFQNFLELAGF